MSRDETNAVREAPGYGRAGIEINMQAVDTVPIAVGHTLDDALRLVATVDQVMVIVAGTDVRSPSLFLTPDAFRGAFASRTGDAPLPSAVRRLGSNIRYLVIGDR